MKYYFLCISFLCAFKINAQVKFSLESNKSKSANIVFIGEENIFKITTPQEISVSNIIPSQGNIRMNSDGTFSWYVYDASDKPVELKFTHSRNGVETELIYPTKYLVKRMADKYQLKIGEFATGGLVSSEKLRSNHRVSVQFEGRAIDLNDGEVKCTILYQAEKKDPVELNYYSKDLEGTKYFNSIMNKLQEGDRIFFEQIKITNEKGAIIELANINFKLDK